MHINNKTICWSIQGNNCYYERLSANHWNNTSHCLVWDLLFVATFEPFLVFWLAFLFVVFADTVSEVLLAFCVLAFLRLPLPVSPPWNAWDWYIPPSWCTKASCFFSFSFLVGTPLFDGERPWYCTFPLNQSIASSFKWNGSCQRIGCFYRWFQVLVHDPLPSPSCRRTCSETYWS